MSTYGLLGYPLAVSFSPAYFADKFQRLQLDHEYKLFARESVHDLRSWVESMPELAGLNVTIPHKQAVLAQLDDLTAEARAVGAVNTIAVQRNPLKLIGHNTDVVGFRDTLCAFLGDARPPALVLGTGGAARAVWYVLQQLGIAFIKVGRQATDEVVTFESLRQMPLEYHQLWINTTPLGMEPIYAGQLPPLPYNLITPKHYLYDLVYHPAETPFLHEGHVRGASTQNGLYMLHAQAETAWGIWEGSQAGL